MLNQDHSQEASSMQKV